MKTVNYRKSMKKYLNDLSRKGLAPGGGSAGALAFCLGISLLVKSVRHSLRKNISLKKKNKLENCVIKLLGLKQKAYPYIDKDGQIFSAIIKSKGVRREKKLEQGEDLINELIQFAHGAFSLAKEVESDIKSSIKSDFFLGIEFVKVSELSAQLNLEANKKMFAKK